MSPKTLSFTMTVTLFVFAPAPVHGQPMSADPKNPDQFNTVLFVSPAGKPFRSDLSKSDQHPISLWFSSVDSDGDGAISPDEFRKDFDATFTEYDPDGNEQIDAFEVRHYEQEIFPEIMTPIIGGFVRGRSKGAGGSRNRGGRGGRPGGIGGPGGRGGKGGKSRAKYSKRKTGARPVGGAARFGLLPIHHPLLDADSDISWRVSKAEFMKAANDRFRFLDADEAGVLTLAALKEKLPKRRKRSGKR